MRPARTSLLAVAGLVGALLGATPAAAAPEGAVPLFEPAPTESPQMLDPLGQSEAGLVWMDWYTAGIWVQPAGGEAALDENFLEPTVLGELITEERTEGVLTWRTVTDPELHLHEIPADIEFGARTATGYVGVRGDGPYDVVRVDLLDDGATTVVGTSPSALGWMVSSSTGAAAMTANGGYRYFAYSPAGTDRAVPTPAPYSECPWLSRAHLFCLGASGIYRISVSTGVTVSAAASPMSISMVETSTGVAFLDTVTGSETDELVLKSWATAASAPTVRVPASFGLDGGLAPASTSSSVLVGRGGDLGRAGFWTVPLPSGTSTLAMAAPAAPRSAGFGVAVAPGSVAWTDNSDVSGALWTRDLEADGTPVGDNRQVADHAEGSALSTGAGRFTYTENAPFGNVFYPAGTRLVDGDTVTAIDDNGWSAVLSGDRLLSEDHPVVGADDLVWRLRDLRTGEVTVLPDAMDYDLWGERLVRMDENGRVRLYDLRTGTAPVELRPASDSEWMHGSVHIAGDVVAWDVIDIFEWMEDDTVGDRATRNVVTLDPAVPLPAEVMAVTDLSTGYLVGGVCEGDDCSGRVIALDDGQVTDLGTDTFGMVDGNVFAGVDVDGIPYVHTLPAYADAPRLLAHPDPSPVAGPGRTWRARVVASRVLTTCELEIRDAESTVVRTLDCADPYAAATVEWDGTDEFGEPVEPGDYTWHLAGTAGEEALVDYDGGDSALAGSLTVSDEPAPTVTATTPADAGLRASQTANVTATFSEAVTGVNGTTFRLRSPSGTAIPAVVTYHAGTRTATLNPAATLAADTEYTATLTGGEAGILGTIGGPLETTSWTFTTGPAPAPTALAPASNGTAATLSGNVGAAFSEPVEGVDGDTFTLATAEDGEPVAGTVTYSNTADVATFNPTANLLPDTRYTATLTGGAEAIRDLAGNPMTTRSWSFTTGPAPTVTGRSPAADATKVGRTANVIAAFSEAVTGVSGTTVKLRTSSGSPLSAAVSYSTTSRKVTVNPTATLAANTKYTVTLTGGTTAIRDAAGNPLATTSWSFTTGR